MKKILSLLLLTSSIFSMQLDLVNRKHNFQEKLYKQDVVKNLDLQKVSTSVFVPHALESAKLYHGPKGFYVHHDNKMKRIEKCFTDPIIRNITSQQANDFHKVGYFHLTQMNDGAYSLKAKARLVGGGPVLGAIMYWVTKSVCYGTIAAGAGATIAVTGGAVVGAVGGGAAVGGVAATTGTIATAGATATGTIGGAVSLASGITTTTIAGTAGLTTVGAAITTTAGVVTAGTGTAVLVTSGVGIATSTITGVVGTAALAETAAVTTGAVLATGATTGGIIAGTVCGIEAASTAVGTFFGMLPTP